MRIAVCVKRVPDTAARLKPAADGKSIDRSGVEHVISPYDEIAVEAAIQLKEKHGAGGGEVVVVSVGPAEVQKELRTCLAMGADKAILVKDDAPARDASSTARILAAALKNEREAFDLVLFGWKATDDDAAQVGLRVAEILGLAAATLVTKIDVEGERLKLHREIEGGTEIVETAMPAVVTVQKGLAEPRYASLKGIMAAKKKPLEEKPLADEGEALVEIVKIEAPPARPPGRIVGEGVEAVPELVRLLRQEAKVL